MSELDIDPEYVDPEAAPQDTDPDAPYGRNAAGKPYTKSPAERAQIGQRLAAGRAAAAAGGTSRRRGRPPAPKARPPSRPGASAGPDYAAALAGLLQIPSFALTLAGRIDARFTLDAISVQLYGPELVRALAETAKADPRLAALLERVLAVGPYSAIVAAGLPLVLQIMANHGAIRPSPEMGILDAEQLQAAFDQATGGKSP